MASIENQFFLDASQQPEDWLDFDQFIDLSPSYSDDYSALANSISPNMALPYDSDLFTNDLPDLSQTGFPDMTNYDLSPNDFFAEQSLNLGLMHDSAPVFDEATFNSYHPYDSTLDFRPLVEAQAQADPRVASIKEKRREAAIALHLQRLCDATALDLDMSSDSNTSFSSPCWSDYMRESISPQSSSSSPEQASVPLPSGNGGMELVLDLNMNATTNVPKKQKPRSQAQKENYIKARKYGACEKHKKQHKRCNCLEKAAARCGASEVPVDVSYKERIQQPVVKMPIVPSPRLSGVPGHRPELITNARPTISVTERVTNTSPVVHPPTSRMDPSVMQSSAKMKNKLTRGSAGRDPQYSTSFVLSPVIETSKNQRSFGHDPGLHGSGTTAPLPNGKGTSVPTWRGCALGATSSNRPSDVFIRHVHPAPRLERGGSTCDPRSPERHPQGGLGTRRPSELMSQRQGHPVLRSAAPSNVTVVKPAPITRHRLIISTGAEQPVTSSGLQVYRSRSQKASSAVKTTSTSMDQTPSVSISSQTLYALQTRSDRASRSEQNRSGQPDAHVHQTSRKKVTLPTGAVLSSTYGDQPFQSQPSGLSQNIRAHGLAVESTRRQGQVVQTVISHFIQASLRMLCTSAGYWSSSPERLVASIGSSIGGTLASAKRFFSFEQARSFSKAVSVKDLPMRQIFVSFLHN
ncbi:hypothetical protein N7540_006243 [Penicillium herquei]|nr:hypothetical protein N7540_006243 [Penicillium herquei]